MIVMDHHHPSPIFTVPLTGYPPCSLNKEQKASLPNVIAEVKPSFIPASTEEISLALSRLAMSCRIEDNHDIAWEIHLTDFVEDLEDVPLDILQNACREWRRNNKFWPPICEFLKLTSPQMRKRKNIQEGKAE